MVDAVPACETCKKTAAASPNLKRCAKCQTTWYCGRECQKGDWKAHKKICSANAANRSNFDESKIESNTDYRSPTTTGLETRIEKPFTALDQGKWLHNRSENDVYKLLIDSFRMRQEDNLNIDRYTDPDSIYAGKPNSLKPFKKFLSLTSSRVNLFPPWWDETHQARVIALGNDTNARESLTKKVNKQQIIDHYGDERMPMQMRMLVEAVYQRGPGGQDGTTMRKMMATMEANEGRDGEQAMSMINMQNLMGGGGRR